MFPNFSQLFFGLLARHTKRPLSFALPARLSFERIREVGGLAFLFSLLLGSMLLCCGLSSAEAAEEQKKYNRLVHEKSPYLQQHKNNPIWWYPWSEEAFAAAREEGKLIFLSIGYSTCHWCHVMEGDSFENEEVAEVLNKNFIAVKVDREERPDVDQLYMSVLQAMTGGGGWPVSMFLTPDRVPFMGATFVPRAQFLALMHQIQGVWTTDRGQIHQIGQQVTGWLQRRAQQGFVDAPIPEEEVFQQFFTQQIRSYDPEYGGFSTSPKFPSPMRLNMLLRIHKRTGEPEALEMVENTLNAMARGGIYDQLGGGFHRYSTDRRWHIPHFEKMLYDNALLTTAYLEAYQVKPNPEYEQVVRGILAYVLRDMTHPEGPFYSAEDADSEKAEGKFYVWKEKELKEILSKEEFQKIVDVYHVTAAGNFNPDARVTALEEQAGLKSVHESNAFYVDLKAPLPDGKDKVLEQARKKLFDVRVKRIRPHLDDKILTAWNGLMISAFAKAYQVLGDEIYLNTARKSARFLLTHLRTDDGTLMRRWRDGDVQHTAYLNDYAFFIQGLLALYQSDFDPAWLTAALDLQQRQDAALLDPKDGVYYFSDTSDATLLQRSKTLADTALPSGNAVAALNLLQLADFTLKPELKQKAGKIIAHHGLQMMGAAASYSQMLIALDYLLDRSKEVAIIGAPDHEHTQAIVQYLHQAFLPNKVIAISPPILDDPVPADALPLIVGKPMVKGKPTAYVCENNICQLPTSDLPKIQEMVNDHHAYQMEKL